MTRLWVLSDLHVDPSASWAPSIRPEFDVLVVAGDVFESDMERSISWTAQLAGMLRRFDPATSTLLAWKVEHLLAWL